MKDRIKIGVIGLGTVGSGVVKILHDNREIILKRVGVPLEVSKIVRRDTGKSVPPGVSPGIVTNDIREILDNPDIDIVVEVMGGIEPARSYLLEAVKKGKHIVTANKALLATRGEELYNTASVYGTDLFFEGSVGGGIPVIKTLREGLAGNRIDSIYGIVNGTSNYILTRMTMEGGDFCEVLKEAQELGYAEVDPTFDVGGIDAAHKLAIIVNVAFGTPVNLKDIYIEGIADISPLDISYAGEFNYRVKLLAVTKMTGEYIEARVHPTLIPNTHLLATVDGVYNGIYISGDAIGPVLLYGKGAGDFPTGSAVVGDIIDVARNIISGGCGRIPPAAFKDKYRTSLKILDINDIVSTYYFRFTVLDRPGVLSKISGILGKHNISIASVIQKGRKEGGNVPLVMMTHEATERNVRNALQEIDRLPVVSEKTVMIRVEEGEEK